MDDFGNFNGKAKDEGKVKAMTTVPVEKKLAAGWTWFSLNVTGPDMSVANVLSSLGAQDGDYIKNQTVSATWYDGLGWFGELTLISPLEMYKIKLDRVDTLKFDGLTVDPLTNPVPIKSGWNWIGYLPQSAQTVSDALLGISPVADDYIKNQTRSGTFYDGVGWFGELTNLEPLDGFMLKTSHAGTLIYQELSTFTDPRDGHIYKYKTIGTQTWMAENLAYLLAVSPSSAGSDANPYYYVYGYEGSTVASAKATANFATYGVLYNWPAAMTACPSGWHLPSDAEWTVLTDYLTNNGYGYGGSGSDIGKSMASTSGWTSYSTAGTIGNDQASNNRSGFTALPGGLRFSYGGFLNLGGYANFWSASETGSYAWTRSLFYDNDGVPRYNGYRRNGFSVRCLQNP